MADGFGDGAIVMGRIGTAWFVTAAFAGCSASTEAGTAAVAGADGSVELEAGATSSMPAFAASLSDDDRWRVVPYISTVLVPEDGGTDGHDHGDGHDH